MKKILFFLVVLPYFYSAQIPTDYYKGTEGLKGFQLKTKLYDIISDKNKNWNYNDLIKFYQYTDIDNYYEKDGSYLDIYTENPSGAEVSFSPTDSAKVFISSANAEGLGLNREHVVPQSTYESEYPMYSDLHYVLPADARINQLRNNFPYGISRNTYYSFTNGSKIGDNADRTAEYTGRLYEPHEAFRGEIARYYLYFVVRYEKKLPTFRFFTTSVARDVTVLDGTKERALDPWFLKQMLQWNRDYKVSQREIDRNNEVFKIQNNRNPFIDHPEWADLIWSETISTTPPSAVTNLSVSKVGAYFISLKWDTIDGNETTLGYRIYNNDQLIGSTKNNTFTVPRLSPSTSYSISVEAYNNAYQNSAKTYVQATTLASDQYSKDLMITKYLEGTTDSNKQIFNNAIEITNKTGYDVDLDNYKLRIQHYNYSSGNFYSSNYYQLEGTVKNGETFVVINPNAKFDCFNVNNAKFVTAAPAMMYNGTQYLELSYNKIPVDAVGEIRTLNTIGNKSLYRLSSINQPNTAFNLAEWQELPMNYCEGLGTLSSKEIKGIENKFNIYPNPVTQGIVYIEGRDMANIKKATIFDVTGKLVYSENQPFKNKKSIDINTLLSGMYILVLDEQSFKIIKK